MECDERRKHRRLALAELTEYALDRGWTIWTDGVMVVMVDPERGREAIVSIYTQLLERDPRGRTRLVTPHILVKRLARDRGWRKVKTIRRPGALAEREGKMKCSL